MRGFPGIVRRGKQNPRAPEFLEVPRPVIDQHVGIDDVLVSAKHNLAGRNEREMLFQPLVICPSNEEGTSMAALVM